jgi:Putative prokaryotic signal transducing protein
VSFIAISSYDNYIPAHIALGRLTDQYINCHLQDEYTVTIDPLLSNAIGGIKLMVAETQAERALEILNTVPE